MSSRRPWSKAEDEMLITLIQRFGDRRGRDGKWNEISKRLSGRTNKDCRKRWFHSLDPSLRKGRWTKEEDETLLATYGRLGPAWKEIGNRGSLSC
ncbi:Homeodomain-like protein [Aspergillus pseudonomiae]|nr:Homeodomain-like protein [Aspergillus pseudonomiae]